MKKNTQKYFTIYGIALLLSSIVFTPLTSLSVLAGTIDSGVESVVSFSETEEITEQSMTSIEEASTTKESELIVEGSTMESIEEVVDEEGIETEQEILNQASGEVFVDNKDDFKKYYEDEKIHTITLLKDITNSHKNLKPLDRDLTINGDGHLLAFSNENSSIYLGIPKNKEATLTINNLVIQKLEGGTIIGSNRANEALLTGKGWTVNFNQVSDKVSRNPTSTNTNQLVSLPEGTVNFLGGTNDFSRDKNDVVFIEAKKVTISGADTKVLLTIGKNFIFAKSAEDGAEFHLSNQAQLLIKNKEGTLESNVLFLSGNNAKVTIDSGIVEGDVGKESSVFQLIGENSELLMRAAEVKLGASGMMSTLIIIQGNNSKMTVNEGTNLTFNHYSGGLISIEGRDTSLEIKESTVKATIKDEDTSRLPVKDAIRITGENAKLSLSDQTSFDLQSSAYFSWNLISVSGKNAVFNVSDISSFNLTSNLTYLTNLISVSGANVKMNILNSPAFTLKGPTKSTQGILITGDKAGDASLNVDNSKVDILGESQTGISVVSSVGDASITVKNRGKLSVQPKSNGKILVRGKENGSEGQIKVTNQSELVTDILHIRVDNLIVNEESLVALHSLRSEQSNSQILVEKTGELNIVSSDSTPAILFDNPSNQADNCAIIVRNPGSKINLESKAGPAIVFNGKTGNITVEKYGSFIAKGKVAKDGIIKGKEAKNSLALKVLFDKPLVLDLINQDLSGKVFSVPGGESRLIGKSSKLSLWKKGTSHNGKPTHEIADASYEFSGIDFKELKSGTIYPKNITGGLSEFTRIMSDNPIVALADELYVPTNADKKLYGHFSVFSKNEGVLRDAKAGEVTGTVTIQKKDNQKITREVKSTNTVVFYEDAPRNGMFEIELDEVLQAGDTVEITGIQIKDGNGYVETTPTKVFDIQPPKPAQFDVAVVNKSENSIIGRGEVGSVVTATVTNQENQKPRELTKTIVDATGEFYLSFVGADLQQGDKIQVFLRDNAGSASKARVRDVPETNNAVGNINPTKELAYHDTIFAPATLLTVIDGPQGELQLKTVDDWDFGTQKISVKEKSYPAIHSSRLRFEDLRSFDQGSPWTLKLTQNTPFQTSNHAILEGANVSFKEAKLTGSTWDGQTLTEIEIGDQTLKESVKIVDSKDLKNQRGSFEIDFGKVALNVPKDANPQSEKYTANFDWSFENTPGTD